MIDYDSQFHDPPAPLALVGISREDSDARVMDVPMLIDSGADASILPGCYVSQLGDLEPVSAVLLEGAFQDPRTLSVVRVVMLLNGWRFAGEYAVDPEREIGVIGRNLLNAFVLELNGPKLFFVIRQ